MWSAPATNSKESNTREFSLEFGTTCFRVDPSVGGRVTEFSTRGENVLCPLDDLGDWTNGGSTFWTSPQSDWGWPPNPLVDRAAYAAELDDTTQLLTLTSPRFELSGSALTLTKRFWPDLEREAVSVEYALHNHGPAISVAGWEVSRVPATGRTFFAGRQLCALNGLPEPPTLTDAAGFTWMDHAEQPVEAKLGADATQGFVAYATRELLFLKTFDVVPRAAVAPGQAPIELYVKPGSYVEIEQQGPYRELGSGAAVVYRLTWYIRGLEPDATPHSAVELTRRLLNQDSRG